jgi:hypothetical protein
MNLMMSDIPKKPELDGQIVENLRRAYNKTLEESVPDRFLDLLKQLKDQDAGGGTKND